MTVDTRNTHVYSLETTGSQIIGTIRKLVHEGNVRRIAALVTECTIEVERLAAPEPATPVVAPELAAPLP